MKKFLILLVGLSLFSCSNDDSSETPTNTQQDSNNSIAYFEFKLNNNPFTYQQENFTNPSFLNEYGHGYSINPDPYFREYTYNSYLMKFNYTTPESIGLVFNNLFGSSNSSDETNNFFNIFNNKPTNFLTPNNNSNTTGIIVHFTDVNGNFYSSNDGEQNSSAITYTSTTESTLNGLKRVVITGTINCKLYKNTDPTQILNLTDGKFKLFFEESTQ